MSVDLSKIKPGDEITIRVVAKEKRDGGWAVRTRHHPYGSFILHDDIVSHDPRPLGVGDRVRSQGWSAPMRILCIHGRWAWLADDEGSTAQDHLDRLERIP